MFNLSVQTAHTFYVGNSGWLVHNCGTGLRNASVGFSKIFSGSLHSKSIIEVREILLSNGFKMEKARGYGYLFSNSIGEEVRVMQRNNLWEARVKNRYGNYLDAVGDVSPRLEAHSIILYSK